MNKKRRGKAVAVIDIGSSLIQMRVSQLCDGAITDIDVDVYKRQIQGYGKFIIDKIGPETKKGRLKLAARKYK